jgi:hypothetical protein
MTRITYNRVGSHNFTVPTGIFQVKFDIRGAGGGGYDGKGGGKGGRVVGRLTVTPGQVIHLYVGGRGKTPGVGGDGGWNGGGNGGRSSGDNARNGGGGGGASDVRIGGEGLNDRRAVAGGGGGAGRGTKTSKIAGGSGGAATGGAGRGTDHDGSQNTHGLGGGPGAGGDGGESMPPLTDDGNNGSPGNGGNGSVHTADGVYCGGGGGGGYQGGGGGGGSKNNNQAGGGGGGNNHVSGLDSVAVNARGTGSDSGTDGVIYLNYGVDWLAGGRGGANAGATGDGDHPGHGGDQDDGGAPGAGGGGYTPGGVGTLGRGGAGGTGGGGGGGGGLFGGGGGAWHDGVSPAVGGSGGGGSNFGGDIRNAGNVPSPDGTFNGYIRITYDLPYSAVVRDPLEGAGRLITKDHQYQYRDLLFGSGTNLISEGWNGLFDATPNLATSDLTPKDRHGIIPGYDLMGGRTLDDVIDVTDPEGKNPSKVFDLAEKVQLAFRVAQNESPLVYKLPGRDKRFVMARPRKATMPKDADLTLGYGKATIQLFATDPAHYDLATLDSGATFNFGPDITEVQATIRCGGTWFTYPVIDIVGDGNEWALELNQQDPIHGISDYGATWLQARASNVVVPGLDMEHRIDMKARTYTANGLPSYRFLSANSRWWRLGPGDNVITVTRSDEFSDNPATVKFTWHTAYLY